MTAAVEKIRSEMGENANNGYVQVVGGFLLQILEANPESAEKILAEGKTIKGSLDEMQKEARKKQVGNCAVLTDQEGFAVVLKYFGIEEPAAARPVVAPVVARPSVDFDVRLDDLLK